MTAALRRRLAAIASARAIQQAERARRDELLDWAERRYWARKAANPDSDWVRRIDAALAAVREAKA